MCNADGSANPAGSSILVSLTGAISSVSSKNTATVTVKYRAQGATTWLSGATGTSVSGSWVIAAGAALPTNAYDVQAVLTDAFTSATQTALLPTAECYLDKMPGRKRLGIGGYNATDKSLYINPEWGIHWGEKHITDAPRNLLDNSDFIHPVNQRGQTSYTTSGYNVDRWRTYSAATVTVTETGLVVDATSVQANLQQNMASLPNGTFTFAAKVNGNIVYRVISNSNGTVTTVDNSKAAFTGGYLGAGKGSSAYYVHIVNSVGYVNTVEWATLYEGSYTVDTLPEYVPKGYGAELAECRRYFRTWKTTSLYQNVFSGFVTGSGKIAAVNVGPGGMRITPTVKLSNGGIIIRSGAGYSADASNDVPCATPVVEAFDSGEQLNLTFKKSDDTAWAGVTNNTLISINLPRGTVLTASADL